MLTTLEIWARALRQRVILREVEKAKDAALPSSFSDELGRMIEAFELCRRRSTIPRMTSYCKFAAAKYCVVDVGDLQLAAPRRLEFADVIEDARVVHVDPGHRVVALRRLRLLFDAQRCGRRRVTGTPKRPGSSTSLSKYARAGRCARKRSTYGVMSLLDDVVAEDHDDRLAFGEMLAQPERIGDAAFALLIRVIDIAQAELARRCRAGAKNRRRSFRR